MLLTETPEDKTLIVCSKCGNPYPLYYVNGQCFECYCISLLPKWYQRAEKYVWCAALGLSLATKRPQTGNDLLDRSVTPLSELGVPRGSRPRYTWLQKRLPVKSKPLWQLEDEGMGQ